MFICINRTDVLFLLLGFYNDGSIYEKAFNLNQLSTHPHRICGGIVQEYFVSRSVYSGRKLYYGL